MTPQKGADHCARGLRRTKNESAARKRGKQHRSAAAAPAAADGRQTHVRGKKRSHKRRDPRARRGLAVELMNKQTSGSGEADHTRQSHDGEANTSHAASLPGRARIVHPLRKPSQIENERAPHDLRPGQPQREGHAVQFPRHGHRHPRVDGFKGFTAHGAPSPPVEGATASATPHVVSTIAHAARATPHADATTFGAVELDEAHPPAVQIDAASSDARVARAALAQTPPSARRSWRHDASHRIS